MMKLNAVLVGEGASISPCTTTIGRGEPEPTCSDGILNQDEIYADCGGQCPNCPIALGGGLRSSPCL